MSEGSDDEPPRAPGSAFDPPRPPESSALETAGATAALLALVAADAMTGGVLSSLAAIPGGGDTSTEPVDIETVAPGAGKLAPKRAPDGRVHCTRCDEPVPYASMSLNGDGYFCQPCALDINGR